MHIKMSQCTETKSLYYITLRYPTPDYSTLHYNTEMLYCEGTQKTQYLKYNTGNSVGLLQLFSWKEGADDYLISICMLVKLEKTDSVRLPTCTDHLLWISTVLISLYTFFSVVLETTLRELLCASENYFLHFIFEQESLAKSYSIIRCRN